MPYITSVAHVDVERVAAWVVNRGLAGKAEADLLRDFCEECRRSGLKLSTAFHWRSVGAEEAPLIEYGSTTEGEAAAIWKESIFFHLLTTGAGELRRRIGRDDPVDFATLEELRAEGETDFIGFIHRFAGEGVIGCRPAGWQEPPTKQTIPRELLSPCKTCVMYCAMWLLCA